MHHCDQSCFEKAKVLMSGLWRAKGRKNPDLEAAVGTLPMAADHRGSSPDGTIV